MEDRPIPLPVIPMPGKRLISHIVLGLLAFLTFFPFLFMLVTSLKDNSQFYHRFWAFLPFQTGIEALSWAEFTDVIWANYKYAWESIDGYIFNSLIITVSSVAGVMTVASLSAFAFSRYSFPAKEALFYAVISLMMIPGVLTLISSYMWYKQFPLVGGNNWFGAGGTGFINSYLVVIIPYVAGGQVFAIFILRTFFASLPEELFEAARIDGGSEIQQFWHVAVPLSKPILGTIAIMNIMGTWNEFIWPSITLTDQSKMPIPLGLIQFQGEYSQDYGSLMAGYAIAAVPLLVLFLFTMRQFVEGLTSGAFKA